MCTFSRRPYFIPRSFLKSAAAFWPGVEVSVAIEAAVMQEGGFRGDMGL